jgi:hypothetical protein
VKTFQHRGWFGLLPALPESPPVSFVSSRSEFDMFKSFLPSVPVARFPFRTGGVRALVAGVALAASVVVSAPASASLVQNSFANGSINVTLNRPGQAGQSTSVGGFTGVFNGVSFMSYCIELAQQFSFGTVYNSYSSVPVASAPNTSPMGPLKALDLSKLMAAHFATSFATTTSTAAMQLAIWEIVYETRTTYDVNSGAFEVTAGDNAARNAANLLLASLPGLTATAPLTALGSPNNQDFITIIPVPPSIALFAGGLLLGLWGVRRRKVA